MVKFSGLFICTTIIQYKRVPGYQISKRKQASVYLQPNDQEPIRPSWEKIESYYYTFDTANILNIFIMILIAASFINHHSSQPLRTEINSYVAKHQNIR